MPQKAIENVLKKHGITLFAPIPLKDCIITKPYLLERENIKGGTAYICAVPYLTPDYKTRHNISAYCSVLDYHGFFAQLRKDAVAELKKEYPQYNFAVFADHSPLEERDAAAKAGLGIIGKNGMLITEKYSSYIFLGELITDAVTDCRAHEPVYCENCGKCKLLCPMEELGQCLSALTQKKGELTENEEKAIIKYGTAWGCDICQEACPYTERAFANGTVYTDIEYFKTDATPFLTSDFIKNMNDDVFMTRAYSWRGKQTILRNLGILEKSEESKKR